MNSRDVTNRTKETRLRNCLRRLVLNVRTTTKARKIARIAESTSIVVVPCEVTRVVSRFVARCAHDEFVRRKRKQPARTRN